MKARLDDLTLDPAIQLRARGLAPAMVEDYAAALEHGAVFPPVVVFQEGGTLWLAGGFHRHAAHRAVGRAEIEAEVQPGTRQEAMIYAATDNATHGRPMSRWEKREAGERLIRLTEWSDREIARRLAVSHQTVCNWRERLSVKNLTDASSSRTVTRRGTTYTMNTRDIGRGAAPPPPREWTPPPGWRPVLEGKAAQQVYRVTWAVFGELPAPDQVLQVARVKESLGDVGDEALVQAVRAAAKARSATAPGKEQSGSIEDTPLETVAVDDRLSVHFSSASAEWLTPPHIIARVVQVLGAIDLDPCSNDGEPNIPAIQHFTAADDGLAQEWIGRVYMNPVYGRAIGQWVEKLVSEHAAGRVPQGLALLPARTDTAWFRLLVDYPLCFLHGRLNFSGHENGAPFPSVVVGLGCDLVAFLDAFEDLGAVFRRVTR
ncbi:MAG: helix-turn-helix domain-containing protein [Chloroflexi bacterium]|nr:helix-turn-helix domain-containing protein [Chloroflexota bacterium]